MKAAIYQEYGTAEVLQIKEIDQPEPTEKQILIKVHAASINDWDWQLLQGIPFANRMMNGIKRPKKIPVVGSDIAGEVVALGAKTERFKIGDKVFGDLSNMNGHGFGGFAEFVCADEDAVMIKPDQLSYEQAAALPQAGALAIQGLLDKGHLQGGQHVLIDGASGGVGTLAVQIAKHYGAKITGVCSTSKMDMVRELGADHVIDYTQEDFTKNNQTYDLILDVKGFHSMFDCRRSLGPKGRYVVLGGETKSIMKVMFLGSFISLFSRKKMMVLLFKANQGLDALSDLCVSNVVTPIIDKTYSLQETAAAMRYYGDGNARGKVVITMNPQ
jgi:NADPH:quinone reductase-like Zn-dependent oxidoreductase